MPKKTLALATLVLVAAAPLSIAQLPVPNTTYDSAQNPHGYYLPGGVRADLMRVNAGDTIATRAGEPTDEAALHAPHYVAHHVADDYSLEDRDGDGEPDFDGDPEFGFGGGFFPAGPWATVCGYNPHHFGEVHVHDAILQPNGGTGHESVGFTVGADPTPPTIVTVPPVVVWDPATGIEIVLVEGGDECVTDGVVAPIPKHDDWLKHCIHVCSLPLSDKNHPFRGAPGGDGGYHVWVDCAVAMDGEVDLVGPSVTPPSGAAATCPLAGHIYFPDTG